MTSGNSPSRQRAAYTWNPLRLLNYYRLTLAGIFLVLYVIGPFPSVLGKHDAALYATSVWFYFGFAILSSFVIQYRWLPFSWLTNIQIVTDLIVLTLIMHASGGLSSGLGLLLVVTVACGSLIMAGRIAILYAAIASLCILIEQVYAHLTESFVRTTYTQAGVLGAAFFATALLAYTLAKRLRESEALAAQRQIDLANLNQLNTYIVRNFAGGIIVVDDDGRIRLMNDAAWSRLGMPQESENDFLARLCPPLWRYWQEWRKNPSRSPQIIQVDQEGPELQPYFTLVGTPPIGTLIVLEDTTEVRQRLQQMKLASLGRLTASIAHEIRNPLGAISHAAQLLSESEHLPQSDVRLTQIIHHHCQRMNAIVESVLQLSRREAANVREITLQEWLVNFVEEFCLSENLDQGSLTVDVEPSDLKVVFDPGHLQQVVWNLCRNAMLYGNHDDQSIRIVLRAARAGDLRAPVLDIIDFGEGIEPKVADQIFEPFYTTGNEGTGLGLYLARELCEFNQASLSYMPVPSGGSCFRLSFTESRLLEAKNPT